MKTEILSTRIDYDTKQAFVHICDQVGLSHVGWVKCRLDVLKIFTIFYATFCPPFPPNFNHQRWAKCRLNFLIKIKSRDGILPTLRNAPLLSEVTQYNK